MTTHRIRMGNGIEADLAVPEVEGKAPGLVVLHEWHGLNDHVRALCERFASEGFVAIAPDLYHGEVASDDARAAELMQSLSTRLAMDDVDAAIATLKASPQSNGKVGVIGFCMGGALAFAASVAADGIECAVPFYGIPIEAYWDPAKVRVPIQAHFAQHDEWARAARAEGFAGGVAENGGSMELHVYDAGHAFMRASDPRVYSPENAGVAWARALAFLRDRLSE